MTLWPLGFVFLYSEAWMLSCPGDSLELCPVGINPENTQSPKCFWWGMVGAICCRWSVRRMHAWHTRHGASPGHHSHTHMQKAHVCRKGMQNAVIVTMRQEQGGRVERVVDAPPWETSSNLTGFVSSQKIRMHSAWWDSTFAACSAHWECLTR